MNSFVRLGIFSENRKSEFLKGIGTILSDYEHDLYSNTIEQLKQKYGHLRPGTYDINKKHTGEPWPLS